MNKVTVIGAGLAGCEAAWAVASRGIDVLLYEMKPKKFSPAHQSDGFAELVCSNSLKAIRIESASGLLKAEMNKLGSLILDSAEKTSVPAGGALAVDRKLFSDLVTEKIRSNPRITVVNDEITSIPDEGIVIIATGPLTSDALSGDIAKRFGNAMLSFYDAAAPIVEFDSIDMDTAFFAARYGRGDDDYINCPMDKEQYEFFYNELINAQRAEVHEFDKKKIYEGCMPVEILAARGIDSIRFGPLKPVGLTDPKTGRRPWAVVQLRAENSNKTMYNIVGFQTNLKFGEQKRVFSLIPGLQEASFVRYGVMHRNTFLDSPRLLNAKLQVKSEPRIRFAGQITGVEGYIESAATGIISGINAANDIFGKNAAIPSEYTMLGSLLRYVSDESVACFQPMGANFGLLPKLDEHIRDKQQRYNILAQRALKEYAD